MKSEKKNILFLLIAFLLGGCCFWVVGSLLGVVMYTADEDTSTVVENNGLRWQEPLGKEVQSHLGTKGLSKWMHGDYQGALDVILQRVTTSDNGLELLNQLYHDSNQDVGLMNAIIPIIVFDAVTKEDFSSVLEQSLSVDSRVRTVVIEQIFNAWAMKSPLEALRWLDETNEFDFRNQDYLVIETWGYHDPYDLLDKLEQVPPKMRSNAEFIAIDSVARTAPTDAVSLLARFDGTLIQEDLTEQLIKSWAVNDAEAALDWVLNSSIELATKGKSVQSIFRIMALKDPRGTFVRAKKFEKDFHISGLMFDVLRSVATKEPRVAEELAKLQVSPVSTWISIGRGYVDNREWEAIIGAASSVPQGQNKAYWNYVLQYWSINDPSSLYARINELPSDYLSEAAFQLAIQNRWYRFLSEAERSRLMSYFSEADHDRWLDVTLNRNEHYLTILDDGFGFSKTYSQEEVLSILLRDSEKRANVLP